LIQPGPQAIPTRAIQLVERLPTGPARADQAGAAQDAQVPGNQRLADMQQQREVGNRNLPSIGQQSQDAQTRAVGTGVQGECQLAQSPSSPSCRHP